MPEAQVFCVYLLNYIEKWFKITVLRLSKVSTCIHVGITSTHKCYNHVCLQNNTPKSNKLPFFLQPHPSMGQKMVMKK